MKLNRFRDKSLIMGSFLASQSLQSWIRKNLSAREKLSFLGSLILIALHFEEKTEKAGPSRLAKSLGFSRSRVSQEISSLVKAGYLKRSLVSHDARSISVVLSPSGERTAVELIKIFTRLQTLVDRAVGERQAELMNSQLLQLVKVLDAKN